MRIILDVVFQRGQHAVIYGERGVGKTSLANVISDWLQVLEQHNYQVVSINCSGKSDFNSVWRSIFRELKAIQTLAKPGFAAEDEEKPVRLDNLLPEEDITPEDVRFALQQIRATTIIVIDEFDRLPSPDAAKLMADTIKSLSDHSVNSTLIIIGVADSIDQLIHEHRSIERAIAQIKLPRMSYPELYGIISKGLTAANLEMDEGYRKAIVTLSQGLPSHTHALCRFAAFSAIRARREQIDANDLNQAIIDVVNNAEQSISSLYHKATSSPHRNFYKEVLLAAALAKTDELGYFAAGDLREPLSKILRKPYGIDRFMGHLNDFCTEERGPVLFKSTITKRPRFRFTDSMMEPFVIMKGLRDKLITEEMVLAEVRLETENQKPN